jgi:hypothetical protein
MNGNGALISDTYCVFCGKKGVPISRRTGRYREAGHLKKVYCIYCQKETNHVEVRPFFSQYGYEDFLLEMKYENFDENGDRKQPYKTFKSNLMKEGVING